MNLKNVIRRSTAGISALCLAASYLAAGSFEAVNAAAVTLYGDFNCDGVVDVNDVTTTINHILGKPVATFIPEAANVDGDDTIDVNDVQGIINIALGKAGD